MKKTIIVTFMFFLLFNVCQAQSKIDPTLLFLQSDKVTMLDLGLLRMQLRCVERLQGQFKGQGFSAYAYVPDTDRILLSIALIGVKSGAEVTANNCISAIKLLRPSFDARTLASFFTHAGFQDKDTPTKLGEKIRDLIHIKVEGKNISQNGSLRTVVVCSSTLNENDSIRCK